MKNLVVLALIATFSFTNSCTKIKYTPCAQTGFPEVLKICEVNKLDSDDSLFKVMNLYLLTLSKNNDPDTNLVLFRNWLSTHQCVESVHIECFSCIKSIPAYSAINIKFSSSNSGKKITVVMDSVLYCRTPF